MYAWPRLLKARSRILRSADREITIEQCSTLTAGAGAFRHWTSYRLSSIESSVCKPSSLTFFDGSSPTSVDHSTVLASSRDAARRLTPVPLCGNSRSPATSPLGVEARELDASPTPNRLPRTSSNSHQSSSLSSRYDASHHDACRYLYWRSRAQLPTGRSSWPTRRDTSPTLVLWARVHERSLPAGQPARLA